jgi:hypothetical protein
VLTGELGIERSKLLWDFTLVSQRCTALQPSHGIPLDEFLEVSRES